MSFLFLNFIIANASATPSHTYKWDKTPDIEVCGDIISREEIVESLKYWSVEIGDRANFSKVTFKSHCSDPKSGTIQISRNKNHVIEYGLSHIDYYYYNDKNDRTINFVEIKLSDHMVRENNITLRHELGHAFGLLHEDHGIMRSHY
jgi:predicted Zn-dependent protease